VYTLYLSFDTSRASGFHLLIPGVSLLSIQFVFFSKTESIVIVVELERKDDETLELDSAHCECLVDREWCERWSTDRGGGICHRGGDIFHPGGDVCHRGTIWWNRGYHHCNKSGRFQPESLLESASNDSWSGAPGKRCHWCCDFFELESITDMTTIDQVTVGGSAGLVYSPDTITANIGDMVQFNFMSQNHTATQSSFTTPCEKLATGVDSGFMPNPSNSVSPPPLMLFQVNTTDPIWMYCRQTGHCGKGMVFSINPTSTKTQAQFQALAISQNGTASSTSTGSSSSAVSVASPAAAPPPPPAAAPPASSSSGSVVQGSGSTSNAGVCDCSCLCGASAFPAGAGIGAVGGMSGESFSFLLL
jgi:plastocyanin